MATPREAQYFGRNNVWFGAGFQITKSLDLTAVVTLADKSQRLVRYNATAGGFTITLPKSPSPGMTFTFKEVAGSANAVILDGNGFLIEGSATYILNVPWRSRTLRFSAESNQWEVLGGIN
jgi:hypothetical protein